MLCLLFYNNVTLYWSAPHLHSGQSTGLKKQFSLFEWCLCNNWATLLPVICRGGWVGECLWKCETWISIVFCTLSSNLFVCTRRWQPADPTRIDASVVSSAILSALTEGALEGPSFVREAQSRGNVHISSGCTCAQNQGTNIHVDKHAMNFTQEVILPDNSSVEEYLVTMATHTVAWLRVSMGNKWSLSVCGCVFVCSDEI